jgi:dCMP deaminase
MIGLNLLIEQERLKILDKHKRMIAQQDAEKLKEINKEKRYNKKYLEIAEKISELSYANKKKVGAIIVKDSVIISDGYNGTPHGFENECEDTEGDTKWYTLHAEANAITKLVRTGGMSAEGSTLYLTLSPCKECAKLILQSGINKVIYLEKYRDCSGIDFLKESNIKICQYINTTNTTTTNITNTTNNNTNYINIDDDDDDDYVIDNNRCVLL